MMYRQHLQLTAAATVRPFSVEDLQAHAVEDFDDDYALMGAMIDAAVRHFEHNTGRALMTQAWRLSVSHWRDGVIMLPVAPVREISQIVYRDADGVEQVLDSAAYRLLQAGGGARVILNVGQSLPSTAAVDDRYSVDFVAGYAADDTKLAEIPADIVLAVKCLATHYYEHREIAAPMALTEVPMLYRCVVDRYKVGEL